MQPFKASAKLSPGIDQMCNIFRCSLIAGAILGATIGFAGAGPCSREIAEIENVMRHPGPDIGPTNAQSVAAQLHRQPTQASVARATIRADARYYRTLARARALDAKGSMKCMRVVRRLKELIGM
jgi:hypothetical protein